MKSLTLVDYALPSYSQVSVPSKMVYYTTKWIVEKAKSVNLDHTRLIIVGDSVGGNMATAITLVAKGQRGPKLY